MNIHPDYKRKGYFVADENPEAFIIMRKPSILLLA